MSVAMYNISVMYDIVVSLDILKIGVPSVVYL